MFITSDVYDEKLRLKRQLLERVVNLTGLLEKHLAAEDMRSFLRTLKVRQTCIDSLEPNVPAGEDGSGSAVEIREMLRSLGKRSEALNLSAGEKKLEFAKQLKKVKTAQKTVTVYEGFGQYAPSRYFDRKK